MVRRNSTRKLRGGANEPNFSFLETGANGGETGANGGETGAIGANGGEKEVESKAAKKAADNTMSELNNFRASLASTASGATGPVYGKDLLIDQLFVLNEAMQPLRRITKEMDDLMGMVKMGTSKFLADHHKNTNDIVSHRIKAKLNAFTKKHGNKKNKKIKISNIKFD